VLEPSYAVLNYEYSIDDGTTWTARAPASASSPLVVDGLTDGNAYPMRFRAVNVAGAGLPTDAIMLTPGLAPPAGLHAASVAASTVTFAWTPPSTGVVPTGYMLEGGLTPGSVQARLPSPGTGTVFTLAAPAGVFHVRVRATIGLAESEPSPEIQVNVGVPAPPSPPAGLLGLADGDSLALAWENTFTGGAPSGLLLDVSGDRSEHLQLPLTDQFSFRGVPPGTYTFALRAINAVGESAPSNAVTLTFPGTCSPPATPASLSASNSGNTIILHWSPPVGGAAPTHYVLYASGPIAGEFPVTGHGLSGAVGQGTYTISVASANSCGTSARTPSTTLTIP
jgi:hypothetical protein